MATIQEIITAVVSETRRIEKTELITSYVKKAVKKAHSLQEFKRDRIDTTVAVVNAPSFIGTVPLPARFKKPILIRPMVDGAFISGVELDELDASNIVRAERSGKDINTYYLTRDSLSFKSDRQLTEIGILYSEFPDFTDLNTSTWITEEFEEALKDLTKSYVFSVLGDKENGNDLMKKWMLQAQDIMNTET